MEEDPHKLIRVSTRFRRERLVQKDNLSQKTIVKPRKGNIEDVISYSNFEVDGTKKVEEWLKANPNHSTIHPWIPKEHPSHNYVDPFRHIYEMGDSPDDPIEVEDGGYFKITEVVTPGGIIELKERWEDLFDFQREYYQKEWWDQKPWDLLVDPGDVHSEVMSEVSIPESVQRDIEENEKDIANGVDSVEYLRKLVTKQREELQLLWNFINSNNLVSQFIEFEEKIKK